MSGYRTVLGLLLFAALITSSCTNDGTSTGSSTLHALNINNIEALRDYFRYTEGGVPIISGHRGGIVPGYPENSIPAFDNTLKHLPAFFEVDPRMTKDSVIVLMHDATLDRTTNGTGKVFDYTLEELKKLRLKDKEGTITEYQIPTLEEAINWSRGKTILNLDKKDVPFAMTAEAIRKNNAEGFLIVTVHNAEQAKFYYEKNPKIMYSAFIKSRDALEEFENAEIPWENIAVAYVGPELKQENKELYDMLHARGVKFMVSTVSSTDKVMEPEKRAQVWREIVQAGTDVLESDIPIEVAEAINVLGSSKQ